MNANPFSPTDEQQIIITHAGDAFISACPGAGKTRVMVERARHLLSRSLPGKAIAFLSFTNAAVSELETRLKTEGVLSNPIFPNFIGTFDSFLWLFFITPFGIPESDSIPRLIPDKGAWVLQPFPTAQPLPLKCFHRISGEINSVLAKEEGYDTATRTQRSTAAYEQSAKACIARANAAGQLDFEDVRAIIELRLADHNFSAQVAPALAARFSEVIVDEAQDCNPADLRIISWLRNAGITIKVICDPYQSIYEFRGGVTHELIAFKETFTAANQLPMNGNFRSTPAICRAIVMLRPPDARTALDQPLGIHREELAPVYVWAYTGTSVPSSIGAAFSHMTESLGVNLADCPILASTRDSAGNAIGQHTTSDSQHLTLRLATAVMDFHFSFAVGDQKEALVQLHRVLLDIRSVLTDVTYHQYLVNENLNDGRWRYEVLKIAQALRFEPPQTADEWLRKARDLIGPSLPIGGSTIAQRLRNNAALTQALTLPPPNCPPARTIHSVKGMQFPAICVVMTAATTNGILTYLETGAPLDQAEEARKIYVAASRAERLLMFAVPRSQSQRLLTLLSQKGADVRLVGASDSSAICTPIQLNMFADF